MRSAPTTETGPPSAETSAGLAAESGLPQKTAAQHKKNIDSLTSLRFFAALWVVLMHFSAGWIQAAPEQVRQLIDNGYSGVELFFILSGFILGYVYLPQIQANTLNKRSFWWRGLPGSIPSTRYPY